MCYDIAVQSGEHALFVWQRDKPTLLSIGFYRQTVAQQKRYAGGKQFQNTFQSNGTLLNDEWASLRPQ